MRRAEIIVRKQDLDGATADIGFFDSAEGYRAFVNDTDRSRFGPAWLARMSARYEHHRQVHEQRLAAEDRCRLEEEWRRLVEAQRQSLLDAAKKQGYRI